MRIGVGVMTLWTLSIQRAWSQARLAITRPRAALASMLVLLFGHGTAHAAPHHAAAVLHHGLVRRNHPALGKIGHLCGVILESLDGSRVGRSLDDDDSLLGRLIRALDLVLVPEDRVQRRALDRQTRVTSFFDPLSHFGDVLLDRRRNLGVVRFRDRANAVWEVCHRASASVHDSQKLDDVLDKSNTGAEVWADSAYRSAEIEAALKAKGYKSRIHRRARRNRPLSRREQAGNTTRSRVRARVEHVFGHLHTSMGGTIVRTIGIVRARAKIGLMNLVYNISRLVQLERVAAAPA